MECLKCGAQIENIAVFCEDCLQSMDAYPIKPGTVIQLHRREVIKTQKKAPKPKSYNALEDQVSYLKKLFWFMAALLVIAVIVLGVFTCMLLMPTFP